MSDVTQTPASSPSPAPVVTTPPVAPSRLTWVAAVVLTILVVIALGLAWSAERRIRKLEQELVRRQQDIQTVSAEARLLAKRSEETARESASRVSLLDTRLQEVSMQRTQLEDLIQSLARSRDENLLVDIDAGLRLAQQQATITGSAEPLVSALKQADERLSRYNQPRLEGVRRAIARDVDRVKEVGVPDVAALSAKLDEAIRLVDELPLLSQAEPRKEAAKPASAPAPAAAKPMARSASGAASSPSSWSVALSQGWAAFVERVWGETRSLVRVTRIDHHDAMMLAPEQAFFVRENLKLRLLNARLALLSRQFDAVQTDLHGAQQALERYFDRSSRRTVVALDLCKQVAAGARPVSLPRPDNTLAALAAATAGR